MYVLFKKDNEASSAFEDYHITGYTKTEEDANQYIKENDEKLCTFKEIPCMCYDAATKEKVISAAKKAAKELFTIDESGYIQQEIYIYRGDEILSEKTLQKIMESDSPEDTLYEIIYDMYLDAEFDLRDNTTRDIVRYLKKNGMDYDDMETYVSEYVDENISVSYDMDAFLDAEYKTNIMLDTDNANYDFCCDNLLNYFGGDKTEFENESSVKWLVEQFGKLEEMNEILKKYNESEERIEIKDKFLESVVQELENNSCSCSTITFLTKMSLRDLIALRAAIQNKDKNSYIELPKETETGLFDCVNGGGSVLEIEMPDRIKVPCDKIFDAWIDGTKQHRYDVDETYGLIESVWSKSQPEIYIENNKTA